jgi:alpha-galactosidase
LLHSIPLLPALSRGAELPFCHASVRVFCGLHFCSFMNRRFLLPLVVAIFCAGFVARAEVVEVPLSAILNIRQADNEHARPALDQNARNEPLRIANQEFAKGIGTEVDTRIAIDLGGTIRFTALAGIDNASPEDVTVLFEIFADGQSVWRREIRRGDAPRALDLDMRGRKQLVLVTADLGNAYSRSLANWAEATLLVEGDQPNSVLPAPVVETPMILTPPPPAEPRLNGARVFGVRPGHPFLFQIPATGDRPMRFAAPGLPTGLVLNPATGRITGTIGQTGTHVVTLRATNARGADEKTLRIVVGESIALTPPMGWNSWNSWAGAVDQEKVLASARAMAATGLIQHGWSYLNIDDTWQGGRAGPHRALQPNEKFPDIKKLCDEIHALGLKVGIYSTPWVTSYANHAGGSAENPEGLWSKPQVKKTPNKKILPWAIGPYSFAVADAKQWAEWGIDYLKYDWNPIEVPETTEMSAALRASGRDIVFSLSNSASFAGASAWARLAHAWRTTADIRDSWGSLRGIGFSQEKWRAFAGPGHWNDPDMLVVGNVGWGPKLHPSRLTPNEQYTHISLWCLLSAPLLIGCPIDQADAFTLSLLTNDEVLAINQDELGRQAEQLVVDGRRQVWLKELSDGSRAVGLFNLAQSAQDISVTWQQLGLSGPQRVRDLWRQQDLGIQPEQFTASVPRHGVVLVRLEQEKK